MSDTARGITFSKEEREFLRFVCEQTKTKLYAVLSESQSSLGTIVVKKLNQTLLEICDDIITKSERPRTFQDMWKAIGDPEDDSHFFGVLEDMQKKGLVTAMLTAASPKVVNIGISPLFHMKKFIEAVFSIMGDMKFTEEQRKFIDILFKKTKAKLSSSMGNSQHQEHCTFICDLMKQTLLEVFADITKKSKRPPNPSIKEKILSFHDDGGVRFVGVMEDMQKKGRIEAMLQEAAPEVANITTNSKLELKRYIDEVFAIMEKFAEEEKEEKPAPSCIIL